MTDISPPVKNIPPSDRWALAARLCQRPGLFSAAGLAATLLLGACSNRDGSGELVLSGNIEVTDAQVSFKVPGRVIERLVTEGDRVKSGQLVARLDDTEQQEQLALRRAELAEAAAVCAALEAGSRPQEIAAAEATLHSVEADRDRLRLDFTRQQDLRGKDAIADRELEASQAQLKVAEARVVEAAERFKLVQAGPRAEDVARPRPGRPGPGRRRVRRDAGREHPAFLAPDRGRPFKKHRAWRVRFPRNARHHRGRYRTRLGPRLRQRHGPRAHPPRPEARRAHRYVSGQNV